MDHKEELFKQLTELLKDSKHFVLEQAPDVFQQIIVSAMIQDLVAVIFCPLLISLLFVFYSHVKLKEQTSFAWLMFILAVIFIGAPGLLCTVCGLVELLQLHFAPKAFLLEKLMGKHF